MSNLTNFAQKEEEKNIVESKNYNPFSFSSTYHITCNFIKHLNSKTLFPFILSIFDSHPDLLVKLISSLSCIHQLKEEWILYEKKTAFAEVLCEQTLDRVQQIIKHFKIDRSDLILLWKKSHVNRDWKMISELQKPLMSLFSDIRFTQPIFDILEEDKEAAEIYYRNHRCLLFFNALLSFVECEKYINWCCTMVWSNVCSLFDYAKFLDDMSATNAFTLLTQFLDNKLMHVKSKSIIWTPKTEKIFRDKQKDIAKLHQYFLEKKSECAIQWKIFRARHAENGELYELCVQAVIKEDKKMVNLILESNNKRKVLTEFHVDIMLINEIRYGQDIKLIERLLHTPLNGNTIFFQMRTQMLELAIRHAPVEVLQALLRLVIFHKRIDWRRLIEIAIVHEKNEHRRSLGKCMEHRMIYFTKDETEEMQLAIYQQTNKLIFLDQLA